MDSRNKEMTSEEEENKSYGTSTPQGIVFPLELNSHLTERLNAALDENQTLKDQILRQQDELAQLKIFKVDHEEIKNFSTTTLSTKILELTRKNRDMTAKFESMKTKMQKLMDDNEKYKNKIEELESRGFDNRSYDAISVASSQRSEEEILSSTQELNVANAKMMQYRQQSQQFRIDLRNALRALAQEVGDGATPQTVTSVINNPAWRGRQQQILTLREKLAECQAKLQQYELEKGLRRRHSVSESGDIVSDGEDEEKNEENSIISSCCNKTFSGLSSTVSVSESHRRLSGVPQQQKKKSDHLEKVTKELDSVKGELKTKEMENLAAKARIQILEGQLKSSRLQVDDLQSTLERKQMQFEENLAESVSLKQENLVIKTRERELRERSSIEIREIQSELSRERAVIVRLQEVIKKNQEYIESLEHEISRLKRNLESCCSSSPGKENGNEEFENRIANLEDQLAHAAKVMDEFEKERQDLIVLKSQSVERIEEVRKSLCDTERHLNKSFAVLQRADACIEECLELGQITNKNILEEVESIRSLMRELKTGNLFSLESNQGEDLRKLKTSIGVLTKEISILQHHLKSSIDERRMDLDQFSLLADKMRNELYCVLQKAVNSFRGRSH